MWLSKLRMTGAAILAVLVLAAGAGVVSGWGAGGETSGTFEPSRSRHREQGGDPPFRPERGK